MNRRQFDKAERDEPTLDEVEAVLKQVLTTPVEDNPKTLNRTPSKAELSERFKFCRRR